MRKLKVLIAGRSRNELEKAEQQLERHPHCRTEVRVVSNGHTDPLYELTALPDLLLLYDKKATDELQSLIDRPADRKPALVVFGRGDDAESVRLAMRAGARDYLTLPLDETELFNIVTRLADEVNSARQQQVGSLHVFINGKGGSGASFLATNVAHGLASYGQKVTLVDLDLQFAGLCRYLDLTPQRDLLDALRSMDDMDSLSAQAFTTEHESGLRLLSCKTEKLHLSIDVSPERLLGLLQIYQSFNDFVIIDLPRHIDMMSAAVLEKADHISVLTQQSYPHLNDTARLLRILRQELGIDESQLTVIVNRYDKKSAVLLSDIEKALRVNGAVTIPNQYKLTAESINSGIPLTEVTRSASISKELSHYYESLFDKPRDVEEPTALQRLLRRF